MSESILQLHEYKRHALHSLDECFLKFVELRLEKKHFTNEGIQVIKDMAILAGVALDIINKIADRHAISEGHV